MFWDDETVALEGGSSPLCPVLEAFGVNEFQGRALLASGFLKVPPSLILPIMLPQQLQGMYLYTHNHSLCSHEQTNKQTKASLCKCIHTHTWMRLPAPPGLLAHQARVLPAQDPVPAGLKMVPGPIKQSDFGCHF